MNNGQSQGWVYTSVFRHIEEEGCEIGAEALNASNDRHDPTRDLPLYIPLDHLCVHKFSLNSGNLHFVTTNEDTHNWQTYINFLSLLYNGNS